SDETFLYFSLQFALRWCGSNPKHRMSRGTLEKWRLRPRGTLGLLARGDFECADEADFVFAPAWRIHRFCAAWVFLFQESEQLRNTFRLQFFAKHWVRSNVGKVQSSKQSVNIKSRASNDDR